MSIPYEQAFNRIRAEYMDMPGMRLTQEQVTRLSGLEHSLCRLVLDDLVRAKFLRISEDGSYTRSTDSVRFPSLAVNTELASTPGRGH